MTRIILDIPNATDLDLLLKLVNRLNIRVVESKKHTPSIVKPVRKQLLISDLKTEQQYKGMDKNRMDRLIEALDIQEPLELLLEQVKS
ncbi:MAG: hypothetical protein SF052_24640 [Bacteroidia bacterium]|nr:hypothetical protein [Bacteroidia bacterium]